VCESGVGESGSGAQDMAARRELRRGVGTTGAAKRDVSSHDVSFSRTRNVTG
jgi:hypothetical protein